ncbi:MAG TPA: S8 family peptidase [Candidatus Kapabacteria bacterium]|nr:S8 family peptidase [Candidatus Kapabacteria bacterium]
MNTRLLRTLTVLFVLMMPASSYLVAQNDAVTIMPSAKMEAIAASGLMRNPAGGNDEIVARAIFVKLRKGVATNPSQTVLALASRAGLKTGSASPIPFTQLPPDKGEVERVQRLGSREQQAVRDAEEDMSRIIEFHYTSPMLPADAARLMARLPEVEYAEPIVVPHTCGLDGVAPPNDPLLSQQYQVDQVKLKQAWEVWKGDTNMVIAIVDAGIDQTHEDLSPNIKQNPGEFGLDAQGHDKATNGIDDDHNGTVDDWRGANLTAIDDGSKPGETIGEDHGTQVSGYAAAATNNGIGIAGAGYLCKFFPIKTALKSGGSLIRAYDGLVYAIRVRHFKIVNCSFGADTYSQALQDLITDLATTNDCAIVAASGNGVLYENFYPAGYDHVFGVGALDRSDQFGTTWGEQVDVVSPGGFSTNPNNGYADLGTATSYATPVVSGIMGLVRTKFPALNAEQAAAHIRLTSDPLPLVPGKERLTGYGRVNALRAVSTDPFSHPAVMVDTVWMTDDNGVIEDRAGVGRFGRLRLRLVNILGNATNVRVKMAVYNTDSSALFIKDTALSLASINTNEAKVVDGGIRFQLKQPTPGRLRFRVDITADGGYTDYHYDKVLFYQPYITYRTPNVTMSLTDQGRIGFADYSANTIGDGLQYQGTSFLYEGGFILSTNAVQVLSNIRSGDPATQRADFNVVELPSATNNYTLTLNDAGAGQRRIGLEMRVNVITLDSVPDGIALRLRTKNISGSRLDSLRIAMFMDWDLDNTEIGQGIDYKAAPKTNVPFYGLITGSSGYYVAQGVARPVPLPIFFAIRNDSLPIRLFDGFDDDEKWFTVSNGIGSKKAPMTDSSDVSLVLGRRVAGMMPGDEDTTLFVIGISTAPGDAEHAMHSMAPPYSDTSAYGGSGAMLQDVTPNPFTGMASITVGGTDAGATLRVFDALGRMVADLSDRLPHNGSVSRVVFNAINLPSGVYQIQLESRSGVESRRIVLMR